MDRLNKKRFNEKWKLNQETGCWIWTAYKNTTGYGWFYYKGKPRTASRVSWILFKGDIPKGLCVLHECDNPLCVNPEHLFLGTKKENSQDMLKKGRWNNKTFKGEAHGCAKLKNNDVLKIRELAEKGRTLTEIAVSYNVSRPNIASIVKRKTWRHI